MEFCYLLGLPGPLYLHPARSNAGGGFTRDACAAQRFATLDEALAEKEKCNGVFGAVPVEHGFA